MLPTASKSSDSMIGRGHLFAALFAFLVPLLNGCGSKPAAVPEEPAYPVRSDWLVVSAPAGVQPSKWYEPGYPPLAMLNQPLDTLTGDEAKLASRIGQDILNTRKKVDTDVRIELGKVLTELYGTPAEPIVPSGELLIGHLKLAAKLAEQTSALSDKRAEVATARANAKTPAEQAVADQLEQQAGALDAEVRNLAERIDQLRNYVDELRLDANTLRQGGVVYRNYCQQCHGLTGDGNGPGARYLVPLPRDYRQGIFKFITTDPAVGDKRKPSRADLLRTIKRGMDGAPMPQFSALSEPEQQALVSYVIHLSLRGESEFNVMKTAAKGDLEKEDVRAAVLDEAAKAVSFWAASAHRPIKPDPNPYRTDEQILNSAAAGQAIFLNEKVGCTTCHTNYGKSAPYQYDSWGSVTRPRNLTVPILRGGRSPEEIYARIYGGIPGSNMPAHLPLRPTQEDKVEGVDKIWNLVHFIMYASEGAKRRQLQDKTQIEIEP
jgi:mono/diheme cytochrome c family protein